MIAVYGVIPQSSSITLVYEVSDRIRHFSRKVGILKTDLRYRSDLS